MRYYKMTDADGNLTAIGTGSGGTEITETDIREDWREEIVRRAAAVSEYTDSYTRDALEAMTNADLEIILAGMGISANMTKANMVTLILAMQEEAVI